MDISTAGCLLAYLMQNPLKRPMILRQVSGKFRNANSFLNLELIFRLILAMFLLCFGRLQSCWHWLMIWKTKVRINVLHCCAFSDESIFVECCYTEYRHGCDALVGAVKSITNKPKHLQVYVGLVDVYKCMYEVLPLDTYNTANWHGHVLRSNIRFVNKYIMRPSPFF